MKPAWTSIIAALHPVIQTVVVFCLGAEQWRDDLSNDGSLSTLSKFWWYNDVDNGAENASQDRKLNQDQG